jgi:hypothetical protein
MFRAHSLPAGDWWRSPQRQPKRGPLSGLTLGRLGWRDALNVSRALAPGGAGRLLYGGGRYRAPRCAAWVGWPRSKFRVRLRPAGPSAFSTAWAVIGPRAVPPGLGGRAQCFACACAQRGTGGGAPSRIQSGGRYRAPRWAAWVGGTRSMFRLKNGLGGGQPGRAKQARFKRGKALS